MSTPSEAARAVHDTLVGSGDSLYDLRYPGPLAEYRQVGRKVDAGSAALVLEHLTLGHKIEVAVRVTPVASGDAKPASSHAVEDVLLTFAGAQAMADPQDRGALEGYRLVSRREEGGQTVLTLTDTKGKFALEVAIAVRPAG